MAISGEKKGPGVLLDEETLPVRYFTTE